MKIFLLFISSLLFVSCNSQSEFNLEKILKMENRNRIVIEIDSYLNKKSEYGEKINRLNESQKTLLIIQNLEREINNGGFHQFYLNSSGDYANEIIDALIKVRAKRKAEIVKKANSEFKNGIVPKNRAIRQIELKFIEKKAEENWNNCNTEFYKLNDRLTELLIDFIVRNKSDFDQ